MRQAAFLTLLFLGIGSLLGGVLWTRLNWRPDMPPYGRRIRSLDVLLHPERYATADALTLIRMLNGIGILLLSGAVGVLVYEALRSVGAQ